MEYDTLLYTHAQKYIYIWFTQFTFAFYWGNQNTGSGMHTSATVDSCFGLLGLVNGVAVHACYETSYGSDWASRVFKWKGFEYCSDF